jgi:hypothetical protein
MSWRDHGEAGYNYATAAAGREMRQAIIDELERQHIGQIDRDALTNAVMQKIDELSE